MDKTRSLLLDQLLGLKNIEMILEHSQPIQEQIKNLFGKNKLLFSYFYYPRMDETWSAQLNFRAGQRN